MILSKKTYISNITHITYITKTIIINIIII